MEKPIQFVNYSIQLTDSDILSEWMWREEKREWMRVNRRQSLAELCNPKLVRLAQVLHRTADREDPILARRKWQPPHNMKEPQTENTLHNIFKQENVQMDKFQQADLRGTRPRSLVSRLRSVKSENLHTE